MTDYGVNGVVTQGVREASTWLMLPLLLTFVCIFMNLNNDMLLHGPVYRLGQGALWPGGTMARGHYGQGGLWPGGTMARGLYGQGALWPEGTLAGGHYGQGHFGQGALWPGGTMHLANGHCAPSRRH